MSWYVGIVIIITPCSDLVKPSKRINCRSILSELKYIKQTSLLKEYSSKICQARKFNSTKNQAWKTATFEHQNATTNRMAKRQRCSSYLAKAIARDIADTLHVNKSVISRDMAYLKQQAQENLKTHNQDKLPEEYQNCMTGINQVLKICWEL
jgi:hypothetical protein